MCGADDWRRPAAIATRYSSVVAATSTKRSTSTASIASPDTVTELGAPAHAAMGAIAARAVEQNGIGRTVFLSSVGAERRSGAGEIDGLAATEVALDHGRVGAPPALRACGQIAAVLTEVLGRPVTAEQIPDDDMRAALRAAGLGDRQVEAMVGGSIGTREPFEATDPRSVLTTTSTTLRAWAENVA